MTHLILTHPFRVAFLSLFVGLVCAAAIIALSIAAARTDRYNAAINTGAYATFILMVAGFVLALAGFVVGWVQA